MIAFDDVLGLLFATFVVTIGLFFGITLGKIIKVRMQHDESAGPDDLIARIQTAMMTLCLMSAACAVLFFLMIQGAAYASGAAPSLWVDAAGHSWTEGFLEVFFWTGVFLGLPAAVGCFLGLRGSSNIETHTPGQQKQATA
ncbi:MAG: hypothetical protein CL946_03440 [Ectothiorhodospiraceae bacterium]|nr:hypothetical protein [Ectothiorhodospiraceae bacterium]